jgi:hypothetical protein
VLLTTLVDNASALSGLTNLECLDLGKTYVRDVSPLSALTVCIPSASVAPVSRRCLRCRASSA